MIKRTLRHLKKEATEKALASIAFELTLEHGLDGFTVEDIVQKAGYSRRTFANYFTCKEEAVARGATSVQNTAELEHLLTELPEHASLLDVLYQLIKMQLTTELIGRLHQLLLLSKTYPVLEPHYLGAMHQMQTQAQETLLDLSDGKYDEIYTYLLLNSIYGTINPLIDGRLNVLLPGQPVTDDTKEGAVTFDQFLETVFDHLRKGF
ncbi:TetR/AcrR family transcriptional regulator [Paenibacillus sp. ACRSA]|uniref:TetR/AcrR family transcriptional regulator n=1 Tax=Paenibacillus sp. ACRSA TaxID=2918211 RepID=UPI001EF4C5C6|nr:TetR/AcrR family transcriptional regulator [Paenibacillus sp. ACRSA]MCG7378543.1 TetR/AcrR family transcriptional regulator [Paenibacillus sp. ACRSA]